MDAFPYVVTIAGHDPCGGAGLTSDIKTFEHHGVYGFSVVTGITVQNDFDFRGVQWVGVDWIIRQLDILFNTYPIEVVKIGLVENFDVLKRIVQQLKSLNTRVKIIWDPILKSSSGFGFHEMSTFDEDVFTHLDLITPNAGEFELIQQQTGGIKKVSYLLKGGHVQVNRGTDVLHHQGKEIQIEGASFQGKTKHGTGCVLSSAIVSNMAKGMDVENACRKAKKYVEQFILSTDENLGIHQ